MSACLPVNCSVPSDYITEFDADPDIDGIGVITSFYVSAWITVLVLAVEYIIAPPAEFANYGRSQFDKRFIKTIQNVSKMKSKPKTRKALQKSILLLSDQQLITGISIAVVGLARLCQITQYHFTTVQNLAVAAAVAHSMTFNTVKQYIEQNRFFRTWRAIGMLLFGALLMTVWTVTGSNDWLEVYGMPALCGFQNLRQDFGPPATTSLALLYWFLLRGWAFSWTVLFPNNNGLPWLLKLLSTNFWLGKICDFLEKWYKQSTSHLRQAQKRSQEASITGSNSPRPSLAQTTTLMRGYLDQGFWIFASGTLLVFLGVVYAAFEVWGSYAFNLAWTCYTLTGSVQIVYLLRNTASDNGMNGSESQWTFGQQLPLLLLILPILGMIEMFFEDSNEETKRITSEMSKVSPRSPTSSGNTPSQNDNSSRERSDSDASMESLMSEAYRLRGRIDTEQRIGMDISDARVDHPVATSPVPLSVDEEQPSSLGVFSATREVSNILWDSVIFKAYIFANFAVLSYIMVTYGI